MLSEKFQLRSRQVAIFKLHNDLVCVLCGDRVSKASSDSSLGGLLSGWHSAHILQAKAV